MKKKKRKGSNTKPLNFEEGNLIVSPDDFEKGIQRLLGRGNQLSSIILTGSNEYYHFLDDIENLFKFSFDHPDKYLQEYYDLGRYPFLKSDMDGEQILHDDLKIIIFFLENILKRIPSISIKK